MRPMTCDHCILRSLVGWKGQDRPSPLHIRRWRPKGPKKLPWMKNLHRFLHSRLWITFHDLPEFTYDLPLDRPISESRALLDNWCGLWMGVKGPYNYMVVAFGLWVMCEVALSVKHLLEVWNSIPLMTVDFTLRMWWWLWWITAPNTIFRVIYGILCHHGNFPDGTFYEQVNKYCRGWWSSSCIGQNPTFSHQQLVMKYWHG